MANEAIALLGIVQVPISNLEFITDMGERLYSEAHTDRLQALFSKTTIDHQNENHWVDGYIDNSDVTSVLDQFGGLPALRQKNANKLFPNLNNQLIGFTQGRHRITAAKQIDRKSWWTVRLFCADLSILRTSWVVQKQTEQYHHEEPNTNGHIYSKLRSYDGNSEFFYEWYMRLSPHKKQAFKAINRRPDIAAELNRLTDFPGLIDQLYLGNYRRYFAWRILTPKCINPIHTAWSRFTAGRSEIKRCVDLETVKQLEGRVPAVSQTDHEWIRHAFANKTVFRGVIDPQKRHEIEKAVLDASFMIPSLRSFQTNMLFLGIAAQVIWSHLIPSEIRDMVKANHTLQSVLRDCWTPTESWVEVQEGEFRAVSGAPCFDLSYNQLFLAAFRQFPYLSESRPKLEPGQGVPFSKFNNAASSRILFQRRASLFGFHNSLIDEGASSPLWIPESECFICNFEGEFAAQDIDELAFYSRPERRWGRPYARLFPTVQQVAFLPCLFANDSHRSGVDTAFVLRDLIQTFLNPCTFDFDSSRTCSINEHAHEGCAVPETAIWGPTVQSPGAIERITGQDIEMDHAHISAPVTWNTDIPDTSIEHMDSTQMDMDVDSPISSQLLSSCPADEDVIMEDDDSSTVANLIQEYEELESWDQSCESGDQMPPDLSASIPRSLKNLDQLSGTTISVSDSIPTLSFQESPSNDIEKSDLLSSCSELPRSTVPTPPHMVQSHQTSRSNAPQGTPRHTNRRRKHRAKDILYNSETREKPLRIYETHPVSRGSSSGPRSTVPSPPPHSRRTWGNDGMVQVFPNACQSVTTLTPRSTIATPPEWLHVTSTGSSRLSNTETSPFNQSPISSQALRWPPGRSSEPSREVRLAPSMASSSSLPRSTCPTPSHGKGYWYTNHQAASGTVGNTREVRQCPLPSDWQGFIESDDSMTTISF
ncbi:hypothetical protein B0T10DRAFT_463619 [Thelonectria olida]|uniref:Uncharacterized protein n=1 Tax=Thelonectria olida TaxID=1576542 RepID=A0A9P8VWM6_9HYPO|nr:hypothetical protein B0T10DRAFT_463619 [Thelonectria olida]